MHPFNSAYTHLVVPFSTGSKVFFMCRCERCVQMKEYLPGYSVCRSTWKNPIMTIQVIHLHSQLGFLGHRAPSSLFECPRLTITSAGWKIYSNVWFFFHFRWGNCFPLQCEVCQGSCPPSSIWQRLQADILASSLKTGVKQAVCSSLT